MSTAPPLSQLQQTHRMHEQEVEEDDDDEEEDSDDDVPDLDDGKDWQASRSCIVVTSAFF